MMSNRPFGAPPRGPFGRGCARLAPVIVSLGLVCGISAGCASSLRLTLLAAADRPARDVALYVDVADAHGRPVVGLTSADFRVYEDDKLVSSESTQQMLANPELAAEHYTLLLIEISSGAVMTDQVGVIRTAAQAWLAQVGAEQRVAVYAFDGGKALQEIVQFGAVPEPGHALDVLRGADARDPATNLNGAVLQGLAELGRAVRSSEAPLRYGTLVVLTDGIDRANRISQRQMLDAVEAAPFRVFTLGIGRDLDDSVLSRVGKTGYIRVEESSAARAAFAELGELIVHASQRQYLLRYCSTSRAGKHLLRVEAQAPVGRGQLHHTQQTSGAAAACDLAQPPTLATVTSH